jgi:hypothetical protein
MNDSYKMRMLLYRSLLSGPRKVESMSPTEMRVLKESVIFGHIHVRTGYVKLTDAGKMSLTKFKRRVSDHTGIPTR